MLSYHDAMLEMGIAVTCTIRGRLTTVSMVSSNGWVPCGQSWCATTEVHRDPTLRRRWLPEPQAKTPLCGKSRARFVAMRGGAYFPYTIPLPTPPRGRVDLRAVGEGTALPNGRVSGPPRIGFRYA
jgi:hypothetical protein